MFSTVLSASVEGMFAQLVRVEADTSNGLPVFHMVGYLSSEVKEAGERVKTAVQNAGFILPAKKIVVNLSPADIRKRGTCFDLPIAIAILSSLGVIQSEGLDHMMMIGELSLDGAVRAIPGVLPMVMEAKKTGVQYCFVPKANLQEGELVEGITLIGVETLKEVCQILNGKRTGSNEKKETVREEREQKHLLDYREVKGQELAKRATEIAVAGHHNLLMIGPPGVGKSLIAKRIPTILPPLTKSESMELTVLYSIMGSLDSNMPMIRERPFREVHHSVTPSALIGGGMIPRPGEISLAHKGVLYLDELAEFPKSVIELLRQPLEEKYIHILRQRGEYVFPADFLLVAAMNPCPCGNYPDHNRCMCTTAQIRNYLGKVSQPILDRLDLCVEVERVAYEELQVNEAEDSETIRKRIIRAREIQEARFQGKSILTNSQMSTKEIEQYCKLDANCKKMLKQAYVRLGMTARQYYKILCVARTIADLEQQEMIALRHLKEAISYRMIDQKYWGGTL